MNKNIITVIPFLIICMFFNSCSNKGNKLKVSFSNGIDKADVRIKMEVLASVPITDIYDGQKEFDIPNGYGENEWYFTYKDTLQGYSRHIKTNRNDKHNYVFSFYKENEKCFVDIKIEGISPLQENIELKKQQ